VRLFVLAETPAPPSKQQPQQQQQPTSLRRGATSALAGPQPHDSNWAAPAPGDPLPEQSIPAQQPVALHLLVTLHGPHTLTKGPTAATWLHQTAPFGTSSNHSRSGCSSSRDCGSDGGCSSTVGLLVAWPTQLLLFIWHVAKQGMACCSCIRAAVGEFKRL
jgi:hypothetical protein